MGWGATVWEGAGGLGQQTAWLALNVFAIIVFSPEMDRSVTDPREDSTERGPRRKALSPASEKRVLFLLLYASAPVTAIFSHSVGSRRRLRQPLQTWLTQCILSSKGSRLKMRIVSSRSICHGGRTS